MRKIRIFYSWQSDVAKSRQIIKKSMQSSIEKIKDEYGYDIMIDEGTRDVPGAPSIDKTIFEKIDLCDVFVCDVTPITKLGEKEIPNPNVMTELGYALSIVGENQVVFLAMDTNINRDHMPFDIRNRRIGTFTSEKNCNLDFAIKSAIEFSIEHRKEERMNDLKDYVEQMKKIPFYDKLTDMTNELIGILHANYVYIEEPSTILFAERFKFSFELGSSFLNTIIPIIRWINSDFEDIIIEKLRNIINRNYEFKSHSYIKETIRMNYLTDFILYYGLGTICVYSENFSLLDKLFRLEIESIPNNCFKQGYALEVFKEYMIEKQFVDSTKVAPLGAKVRQTFQPIFNFMGSEETIQDNFFIYERLKSLYANYLFGNDIEEGYIPSEEYDWRIYYFHRHSKDVYKEFFDKLEKEKEKASIILQGMFEGSYDLYHKIKTRVDLYRKAHRVFPT